MLISNTTAILKYTKKEDNYFIFLQKAELKSVGEQKVLVLEGKPNRTNSEEETRSLKKLSLPTMVGTCRDYMTPPHPWLKALHQVLLYVTRWPLCPF